MNKQQKARVSAQERKIRVSAIHDRRRFMAINAGGHEIAYYMYNAGMTPGHDVRGCPKSWLAEEFAMRQTITPEHVDLIEEKFGSRDSRYNMRAEERKEEKKCKTGSQ